MCELTTIMMAATIASGAVSAYSAIQQGRAEYQAQGVNAQIATRNAQLAENEQKNVADAAAIERRRLGNEIRAARGQANVNATASGLDPLFGTPADLVGDIATAGRTDLGIIGRNEMTQVGQLDNQIADYRDSANAARAAGRGALRAGYMSAAASLLGTGANVASKWIETHPATQPRPTPIGAGAPRPARVGTGP